MVQDVPYDVWRHITSFLSPDEVKQLYTVNRTLFSLAMDQRYKEAVIGFLFHPDTERSLTRLMWVVASRCFDKLTPKIRYPEIAARVRNLVLKPGHICKFVLESKSKQLERKIGHKFHRLQKTLDIPSPLAHRVVKHPMDGKSAKKNTLKIMKHLLGLISLEVIMTAENHRTFRDARIEFLSPAWQAFRGCLRSLNLQVPLEDVEKFLPPKEITVENLRTVSLKIDCSLQYNDPQSLVMDVVLPFLHNHHRTLRTLTIEANDRFDLYPLLGKLPAMPCLTSFKIRQHFTTTVRNPTDFRGLQVFLSTHRLQLIHFCFELHPHYAQFPMPEAFFSYACFKVILPKLERLSLSLSYFPDNYLNSMTTYVHHLASSLLSLDIHHHFWDREQVRTLAKGFLVNAPLRELKLFVLIFEPSLLSALATHLPNLETLNVGFKQVGPNGYVATVPFSREQIPAVRFYFTSSVLSTWRASSPLTQFTHEISSLDLTQWRLRTLYIKPGLNLINSVRDNCKAALVKALPNAETFCGLTGKEYVASKEFI